MAANMYKIFLLLILSGVTYELEIGKNSLNFREKHRPSMVGIINGKTASITDWPCVASVLCLGQVIGSAIITFKLWLVTTAFTGYQINLEDCEVRVGSDSYNKDGQVLKIGNITIHENYTGNWDYDIAVIQLLTPIKFNKKAKRCNFGNMELQEGVKATVVGWGAQDQTLTPSSDLLSGTVIVFGRSACQVSYPDDLTERLICTDNSNPDVVRPSFYDYGDPMISNKTVYGLYAGGYMGQSDPGLFTNIPMFLDWIKNVINGTQK